MLTDKEVRLITLSNRDEGGSDDEDYEEVTPSVLEWEFHNTTTHIRIKLKGEEGVNELKNVALELFEKSSVAKRV
jgi:hypothetical protein